ncbi:Degenerin-like protein asic-2 [Bienertia sinuspersici]
MNRITSLATLRRAAAATAAAATISQSRAIQQTASSPFTRLHQRLPHHFGSAPQPLSSNGVAGTMFLSFAAASSLTQEAHAKEPLQSHNIKDVVLYQYEACPFCNKRD